MSKQIPLPFPGLPHQTFAFFVAGENQAIVEHLKSILGKEETQEVIFIQGEPSSGKSHLLQALCQQAADLGKACVYFPMKELLELSPDIFTDLNHLGMVCLDDVDVIAGNSEWEEALFHLFNQLQEQKTHLVMSSRFKPKKSGIQLPDLVSRLGSGVLYSLKPLTDIEKQQVLINWTQERGLVLSEESKRYLLQNFPRDLATLLDLLERLNHESLVEKRKLTVPFIKSKMTDPSI